MKIVYVRDKNNRKKRIALVSTDVSLDEDEIIALYGKRWDIEPFHKVLKSVLRLTKEFHGSIIVWYGLPLRTMYS